MTPATCPHCFTERLARIRCSDGLRWCPKCQKWVKVIRQDDAGKKVQK